MEVKATDKIFESKKRSLIDLNFGERYSGCLARESPEIISEIIKLDKGPEYYGGVRNLKRNLALIIEGKITLEDFLTSILSVETSEVVEETSLDSVVSGIAEPSLSSLQARRALKELGYTKRNARIIGDMDIKNAEFLLEHGISPCRILSAEMVIYLLRNKKYENLLSSFKKQTVKESQNKVAPYSTIGIDADTLGFLRESWSPETIERIQELTDGNISKLAGHTTTISRLGITPEEIAYCIEGSSKKYWFSDVLRFIDRAHEMYSRKQGMEEKMIKDSVTQTPKIQKIEEIRFDGWMDERGKTYIALGFVTETGLKKVRKAKVGRIHDKDLIKEIDGAYRLAFAINDYLATCLNSEDSVCAIPLDEGIIEFFRSNIHDRMERYGISGGFLKRMVGAQRDAQCNIFGVKFIEGICGLVDKTLYEKGGILEVKK